MIALSRALLLFIVVTLTAAAQVPDSLSFQGCLTTSEGLPVPDGSHQVDFALYDHPTAGGNLWDETQIVSTNGCVFDVYLGAGDVLDVAFDRPLWLGITVGSGAELSPRTPLAPAPYAHSLKGLRVIPIDNAIVRTVNLIGGGYENRVEDGVHGATISGGGGRFDCCSNENVITGDYGTIGGGGRNSADHRAVVAGGWENVAGGSYATIGGGDTNAAAGSVSVVSGGYYNSAAGDGATVGGGIWNRALARGATIAGGVPSDPSNSQTSNNRVYDEHGTIGGGGGNRAGTADGNPTIQPFATVAGGRDNIAAGRESAVGGGYQNQALARFSTVSGGWGNQASRWTSTVSGGVSNLASGDAAVVPGGRSNEAVGHYSFAAGDNAHAHGANSFVWNDGQVADPLVTDADYQFLVGASGGAVFEAEVRPRTDNAHSLGSSTRRWTAVWATDGSINTSDGRLKENVSPIPYGLAEVLALEPVSFSWTDRPDAGTRLGLIAQETELVVPEVVKRPDSENGAYGLRYAELVPLLIRAIQEQEARIEALEQAAVLACPPGLPDQPR